MSAKSTFVLQRIKLRNIITCSKVDRLLNAALLDEHLHFRAEKSQHRTPRKRVAVQAALQAREYLWPYGPDLS